MKRKLLFAWICLITVVTLSACRPSPVGRAAQATQTAGEIFAAQTAQAPTATYIPPPTPTPIPTDTPTSTPTPTDTPTPTLVPTATPAIGIGVPTSGGRWQVTVEGARQETELTTGTFFDRTTYTPKQGGYTFLVVDVNFRSLEPAPLVGVPSKAITIVGADGEISTIIGLGSRIFKEFICVECTATLKPADQRLAFLVKKESINQFWKLQFSDVPPIPFAVDREAEHAFVTEVGNEPGVLPPECRPGGAMPLSKVGSLTYKYWTDAGFNLASIAADGSDSTPLCTGVAWAELQRATDGGALLLVRPKQGWPSLHAIEPDGRVFALVRNGPTIEAQFDPTGRYVLFTTTKVGEKDKEALYVFDRETATTMLVQIGKWINFRFLANGRLLVTVSPIGGGDSQRYLGRADGTAFERLDLPEDIYSEIADDGEHIIYSEFDDDSNDRLFVADLDGSNALQLAAAEESVWGELSPNGQFVLISLSEEKAKSPEEEEPPHTAELHHLATDQSWTILQDGQNLDFSFSADSRWALVYNSIETEKADLEEQTTLYVVDTADGYIVEEIDHAINAVFSPDNHHLAYTVRQADGNPAMYILSLASGETQGLGLGVVSDWLLTEITPGASAAPTPTWTPTYMPTPTVTRGTSSQDQVSRPLTPTPLATPTSRPPTPTPGQHWVLVADSVADFPGPMQDSKWWYLWSVGRNNFIWQDMGQAPNQCYHSPNDWTLEICRDLMKVDTCEAGEIPGRDCSRGDAALLWKAREGGTYRFEWDSSQVKGETTLWFYKHLDFVGSQGPGSEFPYSAVVRDVIEWELFFWLPQYDTSYRVKVYKLQE